MSTYTGRRIRCGCFTTSIPRSSVWVCASERHTVRERTKRNWIIFFFQRAMRKIQGIVTDHNTQRTTMQRHRQQNDAKKKFFHFIYLFASFESSLLLDTQSDQWRANQRIQLKFVFFFYGQQLHQFFLSQTVICYLPSIKLNRRRLQLRLAETLCNTCVLLRFIARECNWYKWRPLSPQQYTLFQSQHNVRNEAKINK